MLLHRLRGVGVKIATHRTRDLEVLLDETAQFYSKGASLEDAQQQVSKTLVAKYVSKFDPKFQQSVTANVTKAYQVIAMAR